jgi:hypothetical protein
VKARALLDDALALQVWARVKPKAHSWSTVCTDSGRRSLRPGPRVCPGASGQGDHQCARNPDHWYRRWPAHVWAGVPMDRCTRRLLTMSLCVAAVQVLVYHDMLGMLSHPHHEQVLGASVVLARCVAPPHLALRYV